MLQYLFTAQYNDGSVLQQTQQDRSSVDPKRSTFFDVDHSKLETFTLTNVDNGDRFTVDLANGLFQVNGSHWFRLHDDVELTNIRVIYYHRHTQSISANGVFDHPVTFELGWQANLPDGSNLQKTITIV